MRWKDLEAADPELASAARHLLSFIGVGYGYLATVARDGGPRIHPINVHITDGRLLAFIVPAPKLEDLRRDGRYALHSTGSEDVDDELLVSGRATILEDPDLRARVVAGSPITIPEDHVMVELGMERVLWGHYEPRGVFPPQYRRWQAPLPAGVPAA
jgi:hypothetical protein